MPGPMWCILDFLIEIYRKPVFPFTLPTEKDPGERRDFNKERPALIGFSTNEGKDKWIYNDLDRIFDLVKEKRKLDKDSYDMFGHSAGGQLLH